MGSLIRCGIVIVGKADTIRDGPEAWAQYVRSRLFPRAAETVHLRAPAFNADMVKRTAESLDPVYQLVREGETTSSLVDASGISFEQGAYFAVLRLSGEPTQRDAA